MKSHFRRKRSFRWAAFSLVELLVAILIVSILAALLLAATTSAKQAALLAKCQSNLRSIGAATMSYASDNNGFLPPNHSATFSDYLRPYLGEEKLLGQASILHSCLVCPADKYGTDDPYYHFGIPLTNTYCLSYAMNYNIGDVNRPNTAAGGKIGGFSNPSRTLMYCDFEDHFQAISSTAYSKVGRIDALAKRHQGKINVLMIDGHIEIMGTNIFDPKYTVPSFLWQGHE